MEVLPGGSLEREGASRHQGQVFTDRKTKFAKVIFLHLSVSHSVHRGACMVVVVGGMHGRGCVWLGSCMAGGCAWQGVWPEACMAGGVHGGGCAWQGACVAGGSA